MRPETIPLTFWDSLGEERQREVLRLQGLYGILWPSGSRVICPASVHAASDWDLYAMGSKEQAGNLLFDGYHGPKDQRLDPKDKSFSLKKNGMNVIIFFNEFAFKDFHDATEFCIFLGGPEKREDRIKVFKKFKVSVTS